MLRAPFIARLPTPLQKAIQTHGLRNSHLLSIAPAGTISLAFADNVSSGIEPAYAWTYERKRRLAGDGSRAYRVEDHAYRLFRARFGATANLSDAFISALEIAPAEQVAMLAALTPYVDAGISKTVNLSSDCAPAEIDALFVDAWRAGIKSLSVFRPSSPRGAILSAGHQTLEDWSNNKVLAPCDLDSACE
jgi:ribonucleoside-diphosphate reductase alpha chain